MMAPHRQEDPPRLLVVTYHFPPDAAIGTMRTLRLVRHLAERAWSLEVLTGDPATFRRVTPVDHALLDRVPDSVRVIRAAAWRWLDGPHRATRPARDHGAAPASNPPPGGKDTGSRPGLVRRLRRLADEARGIPDRESSWLPGSLLAAVRQCRRPDLIYSSAPPWTGHLAAMALARRWRCPWVADFRDPWARAPWREHRPPFVARAAARLERLAIARADAVIFTTQANLDDFVATYGPDAARRFHFVGNGCDASEFDGLVPAPEPGLFVLLHAGSLYGTRRDPRPLLDAVARLVAAEAIDRRAFRLRFLGVDAAATVTSASAALGLGDVVELRPRVPRRDSLQQMVSASALLMIQPGHGVSVPGKFFEYLAAGRPVLALTDNAELARMVQASGVGVVADPGDTAAVEAALIECMAMARRGVGPAPRELFDGRAQAHATAAILRQVLRERRRATRPDMVL